MACNDPTDNILQQFAKITVHEPITDEQLLDILNELRICETRPTVTQLPSGIQTLQTPQKYALLTRYSREIHIHQNLQRDYTAKNIPYPKPLILNNTESLLLSTNLQAPTYPLLTSLPYESISANDRSLYYPPGTDNTLPVFITDTPSTYVNTPTYSTKANCLIAHHNIPTPAITGSRTSILPLSSSTSEEASQDNDQASTDTDHRDVLNSTVKKQSAKRGRPDFSFLSTKSFSRDSIFGRWKRKAKMAEPPPEADRIRQLELQNATLSGQLDNLKTGKHRAHTEREEIQKLETKVNKLTELLENQLQIQPDSLLETKDETLGASYPVIYHLQKPTNIVKGQRQQESLSAIKPTTLLATVGSFDPDTDTKIDFKKFWDRLSDYLRPYELYEHEYVQCLLTLMKGSAADIITDMNKQYKGNLNRILEALQDLFLPQYSIFDDYDELNKFKRKANEHIRTTVRRAMILVWKLEHTVSPAAWPDRQYHLVVNIIKQVIDKKTFRHLRSKELECAQTGTELSISAITDIIALYEVSHELTPPQDIPIKFNVNTMQLTDQPDIAQTQFQELQNDIQALTATVKSLQPKRQKTDSSIFTPTKFPEREKSFARRRLLQTPERTASQKRPYEADTQKSYTKQTYDRNRERASYRKPTYDKYNKYKSNYGGYNNYEKKSYQDRYRSSSRNRYDRYRSSSRNRDRSSTPRPRSVSFSDRRKDYGRSDNYGNRNRSGDHRAKYTLNLYKCKFCQTEHGRNDLCEAHPRNLNTNRRH